MGIREIPARGNLLFTLFAATIPKHHKAAPRWPSGAGFGRKSVPPSWRNETGLAVLLLGLPRPPTFEFAIDVLVFVGIMPMLLVFVHVRPEV